MRIKSDAPGHRHTLVTPVFHDAERLRRFAPELAKALAESDLDVGWIVADDGSGPAEVERLEGIVASLRPGFPDVEVFANRPHLGKGGVVRAAWDRDHAARWLSFCDADGSIDGSTMVRLMQRAEGRGETQAVLASRRKHPDTRVRQSLRRSLAHHGFAFVARSLLRLPVADPQCGAKVIPTSAYARIRGDLRENGFAFDCELLLALRAIGTGLEEVPISWTERGGGGVRVLREGPGMLAALWKLKRRKDGGVYSPRGTP